MPGEKFKESGSQIDLTSSDVIISNLYKDFKTRSIILQKLDLNEKNYKQEIISNMHNEVFNRQLKKVIYPFLYSKKNSYRNYKFGL